MRGLNLFVTTGNQESLRRIKLKVPRFVFLNRFSPRAKQFNKSRLYLSETGKLKTKS
jgi:hypothetical protein